jgi:hypothetical protein
MDIWSAVSVEVSRLESAWMEILSNILVVGNFQCTKGCVAEFVAFMVCIDKSI